MLDFRRELEENCEMSSIVYQFHQKQDGQINGFTDSIWKAITKKHRFSNDTRALEKYYSQCNKVYNFLPLDPADMIEVA